MDILVIDDHIEFAAALCERLGSRSGNHARSLISEFTSAREVAEDLTPTLSERSLIYLNIDLGSTGFDRQVGSGLEVLARLRVSGIVNHCILYSFRSSGDIAAESRRNLFMFSKGTSFIRLPADPACLDLQTLAGDTADTSNIKNYLLASFDPTEFRHRTANWWGVKSLWDIHHLAAGLANDRRYPLPVRSALSTIDGAVAAFLHRTDVSDIERLVAEIRNERRLLLDRLQSELEQSILCAEEAGKQHAEWFDFANGQRGRLKEIEGAILLSHGQPNPQLSDVRRTLLDDVAYSEETAESNLAELEEIILRVDRLESAIEDSDRILRSVDGGLRERFFEKQQPSGTQPCNILLIDDNAENGWEEAIRLIRPNGRVISLVPPFEYFGKIESFYEDFVRDAILSHSVTEPPQIILLDLRLFDESGRSIAMSDVSGIQLLRRIRKDHFGIPILVTTASNKAWTFQEVVRHGADAYWTKEGVDEVRDPADAVHNYLRLQFLIDGLSGDRYKTLRRIANFAHRCRRNDKPFWWTKVVHWENRKRTTPDASAIAQTLYEASVVLRSYLHYGYLRFGSSEPVGEAFVLSGIINKICGIYEYVHPGDHTGRTDEILKKRGDFYARNLRRRRNDFSHTGFKPEIAWTCLARSVETVVEYLDRKAVPVGTMTDSAD